MDVGWIIVIVAVVVVGLWYVAAYNGLVKSRNRVDNAWGQVEVQLKRRYDLIPNLVETVKGYAKHESETLDAVIKARNAAISAPDTAAAQSQVEGPLAGSLRQLFALSESYPDLKANQNFLALQEELSATEGRIAYARQYYNDSVLAYNNKLQQIPTNLIAGALNFHSREYFQADESARTAPDVSF